MPKVAKEKVAKPTKKPKDTTKPRAKSAKIVKIAKSEAELPKKDPELVESVKAQNQALLDALNQLGKLTASEGNEFKARSYYKAVRVIIKHAQVIENKDQALVLPGIGESIASKIEEFLTTGTIEKLNPSKDKKDDLAKLLDIRCIPPSLANQILQNENYKSVENVLEASELTPYQRLWLKHQKDLKLSIDRTTMEKWQVLSLN